jgi:hypothetical protein
MRRERRAAFPRLGKANRSSGTMQHSGGRSLVAGDLSQIVLGRVAQRIMPHTCVDPRSGFVSRQSHRRAPCAEERRHRSMCAIRFCPTQAHCGKPFESVLIIVAQNEIVYEASTSHASSDDRR